MLASRGGNARQFSELPCGVIANGLDSPVEFVAQRLGEELLDRYVELLGEDHGQTRVDVVLQPVSKTDHALP